jgi:hypothetical protein
MQEGIAFPSVIALFAVGSLIILPALNYATTSLKAGSQAAEEFKGIITADAGIEDALWKIKHDFPDFIEPYTINSVNDFSIDIDIDEVDIIAGEVVNSGVKAEDFIVTASVNETVISENLSIYDYTLSATNNGTGYIKIEMFLIDFPAGIEYVENTTSSNITKPANSDPTSIIGSSSTGITLIWDNTLIPGGLPSIWVGENDYMYFQLSGPPGIQGVEGHGFVAAQREDIGDVWIGDVVPYSIIASARNAQGEIVSTIRAGVWAASYGDMEITCWQVLP